MANAGARPERTGGDANRRRYVVVGLLLAAVAFSNLIQGVWAQSFPGFNLSSMALAALGLLLLLLPFRDILTRPLGLFLLAASLVPGFFHPALNPGAITKQSAILVLVLAPLIFGFAAARSPRVLQGFVFGAVLFAGIAFIGQWLIPDVEALAGGRRTPEGTNAIAVGRLLGFGAFACFMVAASWRIGRLRKIAFLASAFVFSYGAIAAASRGPLLATVLAVSVAILVTTRISGIRRVLVLCIVAGAVVFQLQDLVSSGSRITDADDSGRLTLFRGTWEVAADHPWGVGWGNLYNHLPSYALIRDQGFVQYPHNIFLEVLAEGGLASLLFFAAGLALTATSAFRLRKLEGGGFLLGALVYSLAGALLSSDITGNRLLWVVSAICLGLGARMASEAPDSQAESGSRSISQA